MFLIAFNMSAPRMHINGLIREFYSKTAPSPRLLSNRTLSRSLRLTFCTSVEPENDEVKLSSYLCIPPSMSQNHVGILTPYFGHIDVSSKGIERTRANLVQRGMPAMDIEGMAKDWVRFRELRTEVVRLERAEEKTRREIRQKLEQGMTKEQTEHLMDSVRRIKDETKPLAQSLKDLQEVLMPKILALPGDIHPATPLSSSIAGSEGAKDLEGATMLSSGPFYKGPDAFLELAALDYFSDVFAANGFEPFSGPDFCKPIVIEGCGLDFDDPSQTFHLKSDGDSKRTEFHLVGSASLPSFCAYFTKSSVPTSLLPLKYFTVGRSYSPLKNNDGLSAAQSSCLHFFVATGSVTEEDAAFSSCLETLAGTCEKLGFRYRLVESTPAEMSRAESRLTRLQLWLPKSGVHRTVANVASCGEFISRRLWMCRHDEVEGASGFLRVVHGTGMSFPALLDCVVDSGRRANGQLQLPSPLLNYVANYG